MADKLCHIFGVRHLSPAAAHHLRTVLDEVRPTAVLVEGPSDATEQLKHLVHKDTKPPIALLAYTKERPVRSILYPLAEYSPEWVALTWGVRNKADTRFIDLPAAVFLQLHHAADAEAAKEGERQPPVKRDGRKQASEHTRAYLDDPWEAIARLAGDPDHETWWERHFEHTTDVAAYAHQVFELGRGLRDLKNPGEHDEDLVREAYMRRCIREVLTKGHKPERVLVVCGAFHAPVLTHELPPMSDREVKALPRAETSLTLMPYTYYRLSSQSGYGAGNHAPMYFQRLHEERSAGRGERLAARYLTEVCHAMRRGGQIRSAAEVIEAVRLAHTLAALNDGCAPTLRDLRDAAITCLGRGEHDLVRPFLQEVEVGHAIGKLPKGVSRTALQDDFYLQLENLRLDKLQVDKDQPPLELDLRENRFVKGEEAAFRDRNRSIFLHRLVALGLDFGKPQTVRQDQGTWKEIWTLRWKPDCEIQLVEAALKGDTVETVAAVCLSEQLEECQRVDQAADLVQRACVCGLQSVLADALRHLQALAVDATGLIPLARAAQTLRNVIHDGTVRKFDPTPLRPLVTQLFLRATLQARAACVCDEAAAIGISDKEEDSRRARFRDDESKVFPRIEDFGIRRALQALTDVAYGSPDVEPDGWEKELQHIAAADALNPFLSGRACSILIEKNRIAEEELAREVSRRLSPGVDPKLGAGWFEGLVQGNRQALFSRLPLWRQLDAYIVSLQDDEFRQALVYLRRAFGQFEPGEIRRVVSNLVELSQEGAEELKASVDVKLSEEEAKKIQEQIGDLDLNL